MATTHGTTTHLPAGSIAASRPLTADELREYGRILKISDEIFSGSHPRLKVPQQFVRKPGARSSQNASPSQRAFDIKPSKPATENAAPKTAPSRNKQAQVPRDAPPLAPAKTAPSSARVVSKPASEIDPIFLTKSDDLVRAEIQLQRQRLERTIRDQFEQKKLDSKNRPAIQDTRPDFDVSDILDKALQVVKPVSLSESSEANADSFDDNSFYSSRAPDSPPPAESLRKVSPVAPAQSLAPGGRGQVEYYADELRRLEALNPPGSDQEMQDAYPVTDQRVSYRQKQAEAVQPPRDSQLADAQEESEYSPPAPVAPPIFHRDHQAEAADAHGRGRHLDQIRNTQHPASLADVTIVRQNTITSPAAPRPSRVSPLAVAKVASVQQKQGKRNDLGYTDPESAQGSPSGPAQRITPRKRRRVDDPPNMSIRGQNAGLSDTFVKQEPVSPPPFADDPAIIRAQHLQEQPAYIDIASPRYTPVFEGREPSARRPVYEAGAHYEIPVEQGYSRTSSRLSTRRPQHDDGDLRRVASLQHAKQAEYPRDYVEVEPRRGRAASYTVMTRHPHERARYYDEFRPGEARYVAVDDASQPVYRDPYYENGPPARTMVPPQYQIVVDEHGNEFEMVPRLRQQPMAPPPRPVSRMPEGEIYEDRVHIRPASSRASSVIQDEYGERRYVQEMAPPQPIYRRVVSDYARPSAHDRRVYATPVEGHEPYPRSGSVQVAEYLPHRPAYVEEHAVPQERLIRTSVRPQQPRYEEPRHESIQRMGSTRPTTSSGPASVFLEERRMGEYTERPYYVREQRYHQPDDPNRWH